MRNHAFSVLIIPAVAHGIELFFHACFLDNLKSKSRHKLRHSHDTITDHGHHFKVIQNYHNEFKWLAADAARLFHIDNFPMCLARWCNASQRNATTTMTPAHNRINHVYYTSTMFMETTMAKVKWTLFAHQYDRLLSFAPPVAARQRLRTHGTPLSHHYFSMHFVCHCFICAESHDLYVCVRRWTPLDR